MTKEGNTAKCNRVENNTAGGIMLLCSGGILCPGLDNNSMIDSWAGKINAKRRKISV